MNSRIRSKFALGSFVAIIGLACTLVPVGAGPLTPPAGPVTSTTPSLRDLGTAISNLGAGGGDSVLDHASTPGSSTDGRPHAPVITGARALLEIDGISHGDWHVADFGRLVEVVAHNVAGPGGQIMTVPIPGTARFPEVTLIRLAQAEDLATYNFFQSAAGAGGGPPILDGRLTILNNGMTVIRIIMTDAFASAYDLRFVDGVVVEQVKLVMEFAERDI